MTWADALGGAICALVIVGPALIGFAFNRQDLRKSRNETTEQLSDAIATKKYARVVAILVAKRHLLNKQQILESERWLALEELRTEERRGSDSFEVFTRAVDRRLRLHAQDSDADVKTDE